MLEITLEIAKAFVQENVVKVSSSSDVRARRAFVLIERETTFRDDEMIVFLPTKLRNNSA